MAAVFSALRVICEREGRREGGGGKRVGGGGELSNKKIQRRALNETLAPVESA